MGSNVVVGRRKTWKFGPLALRANFLAASSPCSFISESVVQDVVVQSGQSSERSAIASYIHNHSKAKDNICVDTTATIYQESDRLSASALLTPTSYLGINENRTNAIQQIDRSEPKYIVVNNQVELTSNMKDLLKKIIV